MTKIKKKNQEISSRTALSYGNPSLLMIFCWFGLVASLCRHFEGYDVAAISENGGCKCGPNCTCNPCNCKWGKFQEERECVLLLFHRCLSLFYVWTLVALVLEIKEAMATIHPLLLGVVVRMAGKVEIPLSSPCSSRCTVGASLCCLCSVATMLALCLVSDWEQSLLCC